MKKTLIALAALAVSAGTACAQSGLTLYGVVDTGFIKETGSDIRMGGHEDSAIGFRGTEDLGNGFAATFELEWKLDLNNGMRADEYNFNDAMHHGKESDWQGPANVGLASNTWGAIRLGRINALSVETFRMLDPFDEHGVSGALSKTPVYAEQISNTVRYDSPVWNGFGFGASYSLGADDRHTSEYRLNGNDGFAVSLTADNGPLLLLANFDRRADSNRSWLWNAGGAYTWQAFTVSLGYQDSTFRLKDRDEASGDTERADIGQSVWLLGLQHKTGPHTVNASYNRGKVEAGNISGKVNKYALGYMYDLSRRTSLYASLAFTDFDNEQVSGYYMNDMAVLTGSETERYNTSVTGVQIGITHRF